MEKLCGVKGTPICSPALQVYGSSSSRSIRTPQSPPSEMVGVSDSDAPAATANRASSSAYAAENALATPKSRSRPSARAVTTSPSTLSDATL